MYAYEIQPTLETKNTNKLNSGIQI